MKKWNKKQFYLSTIVIFLPMVVGFLLWNHLPDRLTTHWGASGEADGSMGKFAAITVVPTIIFVMHLFCLFMVHLDPKVDAQSAKALLIVYWAMPLTSLFAGFMVLGSAAVSTLKALNYLNLFLGILFLLTGNYLPKCRQNSMLGIRLPWTLTDEENWNKTHRLGGRVCMAGGALLALCAFLPARVQLFALVGMMAVILAVVSGYSYWLYRGGRSRDGF